MTIEEELGQQLEQRIAAAQEEGQAHEAKPVNLIEHNLNQVRRIVANLTTQREQLEAEIEARQLRLRHVRASLEAFGLAIERLRP